MDISSSKIPGGHALCFVCLFPQSVNKVWSAITDSEGLGRWLAPGSIELRYGGRVRLEFKNEPAIIESIVEAVDPPILLEYPWRLTTGDAGTTRWELRSEPGGTRLILLHTLPSKEDRPAYMAGWQAHLELLTATLEGAPRPWSNDRWIELRDQYAATAV